MTAFTATQAAISALPVRSNAELMALQAADPSIGALLPFWQEQRMPGHIEKHGLPPECIPPMYLSEYLFEYMTLHGCK